MIKITANINKRLPLPDRFLNSMSFSAGFEVELEDLKSQEELKPQLADLYQTLNDIVNSQVNTAIKNHNTSAENSNDLQNNPRTRSTPAGYNANRTTQPPKLTNQDQPCHPTPTPANKTADTGQPAGSSPQTSTATEKQIRLIIQLAKASRLNQNDLNKICQQKYQSDYKHLSKANASDMIKCLQGRGK